MGLFNWRRADKPAGVSAVADPQNGDEGAEARGRPSQAMLSGDPNLAVIFGSVPGVTDEVVTLETALRVPSVSAAVSFLSRTLASLPLKVFEKGDDGRAAKPDDPAAPLLSRAANEETSAFEWRRSFWQGVFTKGRSISFIECNGRGHPINLWPLDIDQVTLERRAGRTLYHYQDGARSITYQADEVIDLCFMPGANRLSSRSPIYDNADTIGMALAVTRYGARFFANGGIPPFSLSGPFKTAGGVERAAADMTETVKRVAAEGGNAIVVPEGHGLQALGIDPEKMQMIEVQRWLVEQFARIYGLPPVFLQDLTHGTFSNTEQQDLHLVKHLIAQWVKAFEAELNLKLWGRKGGRIYAEHVLEGLMRGDLKSRTEANARQIATGQRTVDEVRETDNLPPVSGGNRTLVQGAMIPLEQAGAAYAPQSQKEGGSDAKD